MTEFSLTHRSIPPRSGSPPHPGLVLLHGLGSNELDLLSMAPQVDARAYIISARAPLSSAWGGYMWYDLERHGPGLGSESIETSLNLLGRFLGEVLQRYPIDAQSLYLGGFSMGAAMAGALALLEPERVAGVIMLSGYLPPDPTGRYRGKDAAGRPFFQAHGTMDPLVPIEAARRTRAYLDGTGVELTYREYPIDHGVSFDELLEVSTWLSAALDRGAPEARSTG